MSDFFNLDNSKFSRVIIFLLGHNDIRQYITDIANFVMLDYEKTKLIVIKMYKFGMLKRYSNGGHSSFRLDMDSPIVKTFIEYYGSVIKLQNEKGRK